jgi:hypothetical protein
MKTSRCLVVAVVTALLAGYATGDWNLGDPHKMHFPQLPDPNGWDVNIVETQIGDDWTCGGTGPVDDIHFWVSWFQNAPTEIDVLHVGIWSNVPADPIEQMPSRPGQQLWSRDFQQAELAIPVPPSSGDQGFYTPHPETSMVVEHDHSLYWQINITDIADPFEQTRGEIYWLTLQAEVDRSVNEFATIGWKTSLDHHEDDAAYTSDTIGGWRELLDPLSGASMDMAFVITPEPAALAILALGACMVLVRRR